MSSINVTPLVDVMLVLLIVFMITAPMLTVGVQVDLPKTKANQLNSDADPLIITICLLYTSPSPRDRTRSRMPSSA